MTAAATTEPQLEFFEDGHTYKLDGRPIPSVTTILSYGRDLSRIPAWTSQRGTALHLATEYYDEGDLDWDTVDPLVKPHLDAYAKWCARACPNFVASEMRVWGEIGGLLYCGTIDRVVEMPPGDFDREILRYVIDLKSGAPRKEHGAQVWAYAVAYEQRTDTTIHGCGALYLGKDAAYEMRPYNEREHLETFRVALARYYEQNGE